MAGDLRFVGGIRARALLAAALAVAVVVALASNSAGADPKSSHSGGTRPLPGAAWRATGDASISTGVPAVTMITPNRGPVSGGTVVTVTGSNLGGAIRVLFDWTAGTGTGTGLVRISATQLKITSPAHTAGVFDIRVITPAGTSAALAGDRYTYISSLPSITSLSPGFGPATGSTVVTVTGSNFGGAVRVLFGWTAGTSLVRISATQLKITSPAHGAGVFDVRVTTPAGTSDAVAGDRYTYTVEVLDHMVLSPSSTTVAPGEGEAFAAEGYGGSGDDLGDITAATTFSISPDGSCSGPTCIATATGLHTVTGNDGSVSATASLTVSSVDHLALSPASPIVGPSGTATFEAEGYDASNNDLGNLAAQSTFTISPSGMCTGSTCGGAAQIGTYTVTATDGSAMGTATLTVTAQKLVELLFSRSEVTATDGGCVADDSGVARLDTVVEPYLQSLGLAATGSIQTGPTQATAFWCAHYGLTMATSWGLAQQLAADGWTFVSHSLDYPSGIWSTLTLAQKWDETCGSAQTIDANGLPGGDSMFVWPDNKFDSQALTNFVEPCFATNRVDDGGVSTGTQLNSPPYQQSVAGMAGGWCNVSEAPCSVVPGAALRYRTPAQIIGLIQSLQPGHVLTLQVYLTVTGTSPPYSTNTDRWDCTASDPNYHWTNDTERYCWTDLQTVLQYLVNSGLTITQPGVVDGTFGRTGYSDQAVPRPPS